MADRNYPGRARYFEKASASDCPQEYGRGLSLDPGQGSQRIAVLLTLIKPMVEGMRISLAVFKRGRSGAGMERTDADLPPGVLLKLTLLMILLLGATFQSFVADSGLPVLAAWTLVVAGVVLAFVFGFLVAAACGYMAGLVGSSASPISGIAVIAILASSMIFIGIGQAQDLLGKPES